jgi:hypothetical protein
MATKREVMLGGIPAKLAHMLASDQISLAELPLVAGGPDQASAPLLEKNIAYVTMTAPGQAVRLRPATGQYLHFVRNGSSAFGPLTVWADSDENFNLHAPGETWGIAPGGNAIFIPSRRQWAAISGLNDSAAGQSLVGPVGIGMHAPADATAGDMFIGEVLCIALGLRGVQAPPATGRLCFNAYFDANGVWRYLANGPAMQLRFDGNSGALAFHTVPSGTADSPIGAWDPTPPSTPVVSIGPTAMSLGAVAPLDAAQSSFFANYICVPWSAGVGGNLAARINLNCYFDQSLALRYAAAGPAYRIVFPSTAAGTPGMHVRSVPAGATDAVLPAMTEFFAALAADQLASGQTNIMLTTNEAGTVTYQQVLVGTPLAAAADGMPVGARPLYVMT